MVVRDEESDRDDNDDDGSGSGGGAVMILMTMTTVLRIGCFPPSKRKDVADRTTQSNSVKEFRSVR